MSGPPDSSAMKPKPRSASQFLSRPVAIRNSLSGSFAKFHARLAAIGEGDARGFQHSHNPGNGGMTTPDRAVACLHSLQGRHTHASLVGDFLLAQANQGAGGPELRGLYYHITSYPFG